MDLPLCITPRPGEKVVAYNDSVKIEGEFIGYNTSDCLLIANQFGNTSIVNDYLKVRPKYPLKRNAPNWQEFHNNGQTVLASKDEIYQFDKALNKRIPPGPSYFEFIEEIWSRGYEIYLVGGTVRDVIHGGIANDVDLVTSMPFHLLIPLAESMYGRKNYSRSEINGYISVAGKDKFDPNIDVKNFFLYAPGTQMATFGSDLNFDCKLRDFTFNSIYYDPINKFYIDPSGRGLDDARSKTINIVKDFSVEHPLYNQANILIRFFKFLQRGYKYSDEALDIIKDKCVPLFPAMGHSKRISYFKSQIFKKQPSVDRIVLIDEIKKLMDNCGCIDVWVEFYEKHIEELKG